MYSNHLFPNIFFIRVFVLRPSWFFDFYGLSKGQVSTWHLKPQIFFVYLRRSGKTRCGFQILFIFTLFGEDEPILTYIFQRGLKPPTSYTLWCERTLFAAMSNVSTRMSFYFESELNLLQGTCILKKGQSNSIQKKHIPYHPWDCYIYLLIYHKTTY